MPIIILRGENLKNDINIFSNHLLKSYMNYDITFNAMILLMDKFLICIIFYYRLQITSLHIVNYLRKVLKKYLFAFATDKISNLYGYTKVRNFFIRLSMFACINFFSKTKYYLCNLYFIKNTKFTIYS